MGKAVAPTNFVVTSGRESLHKSRSVGCEQTEILRDLSV